MKAIRFSKRYDFHFLYPIFLETGADGVIVLKEKEPKFHVFLMKLRFFQYYDNMLLFFIDLSKEA